MSKENTIDILNDWLHTNHDSILAVTNHIKANFIALKDYDVNAIAHRPVRGAWDGFRSKDGTFGALIISDQEEVKVCALADFKNNMQMIAEIDMDGFGDRYQYGTLDDIKLLALKS